MWSVAMMSSKTVMLTFWGVVCWGSVLTACTQSRNFRLPQGDELRKH